MFYLAHAETVQHLMLVCDFLFKIWYATYKWLGFTKQHRIFWHATLYFIPKQEISQSTIRLSFGMRSPGVCGRSRTMLFSNLRQQIINWYYYTYRAYHGYSSFTSGVSFVNWCNSIPCAVFTDVW